jgi:hypothetical protein
MRQAWIIALAVLAGATGPFYSSRLHAQKGKPQTDQERLQGTWQLVSVERVFITERIDPMTGKRIEFKTVRRVRGEDRCKFEKWTFKGKEVAQQGGFGGGPTEEYRLDAKKILNRSTSSGWSSTNSPRKRKPGRCAWAFTGWTGTP